MGMSKAISSRSRKPDTRSTGDPETPTPPSTWLGQATTVLRVLSDGTRQPATDEEVAALRALPTQPDHVLVEILEGGAEQVLVLDQDADTPGELFGASNESNGPHFKVVDNPQGREGFDDLTRRALGLK